MLSAAAVALAGTPRRPATLTRMISGVTRVKPNEPSVARVSASRRGDTGAYTDEPAGGGAACTEATGSTGTTTVDTVAIHTATTALNDHLFITTCSSFFWPAGCRRQLRGGASTAAQSADCFLNDLLIVARQTLDTPACVA